jgi:hypothetical protein
MFTAPLHWTIMPFNPVGWAMNCRSQTEGVSLPLSSLCPVKKTRYWGHEAKKEQEKATYGEQGGREQHCQTEYPILLCPLSHLSYTVWPGKPCSPVPHQAHLWPSPRPLCYSTVWASGPCGMLFLENISSMMQGECNNSQPSQAHVYGN